MKEQMTTKEAAEKARAALEGINKSGGIFIYATKEWLELVIKALEAQAELEEQVAWVKDALENGEFEQSCKTCKHDNKPWYTEPCDSCISSYGVINGYERADVRENRTSGSSTDSSTDSSTSSPTDCIHREVIEDKREGERMSDYISREDALSKKITVPIAPVLRGEYVHYEDVIFVKDIEELSSITPKTEWVPVSERLPEEEINPITQDYYEYQCTFKNGNISDVRHYKFGRGHWWHGPGIMDEYVTAWMPLPKPFEPQERNDKE